MSGLGNVLGNVYGDADDQPQQSDLRDVEESIDALVDSVTEQSDAPEDTAPGAAASTDTDVADTEDGDVLSDWVGFEDEDDLDSADAGASVFDDGDPFDDDGLTFVDEADDDPFSADSDGSPPVDDDHDGAPIEATATTVDTSNVATTDIEGEADVVAHEDPVSHEAAVSHEDAVAHGDAVAESDLEVSPGGESVLDSLGLTGLRQPEHDAGQPAPSTEPEDGQRVGWLDALDDGNDSTWMDSIGADEDENDDESDQGNHTGSAMVEPTDAMSALEIPGGDDADADASVDVDTLRHGASGEQTSPPETGTAALESDAAPVDAPALEHAGTAAAELEQDDEQFIDDLFASTPADAEPSTLTDSDTGSSNAASTPRGLSALDLPDIDTSDSSKLPWHENGPTAAPTGDTIEATPAPDAHDVSVADLARDMDADTGPSLAEVQNVTADAANTSLSNGHAGPAVAGDWIRSDDDILPMRGRGRKKDVQLGLAAPPARSAVATAPSDDPISLFSPSEDEAKPRRKLGRKPKAVAPEALVTVEVAIPDSPEHQQHASTTSSPDTTPPSVNTASVGTAAPLVEEPEAANTPLAMTSIANPPIIDDVGLPDAPEHVEVEHEGDPAEDDDASQATSKRKFWKRG